MKGKLPIQQFRRPAFWSSGELYTVSDADPTYSLYTHDLTVAEARIMENNDEGDGGEISMGFGRWGLG